jgi:hypothetical protein
MDGKNNELYPKELEAWRSQLKGKNFVELYAKKADNNTSSKGIL